MEATRLVPASSQEVLEFVLDLDRYREADHKIRRVVQPIVLDADGNGRTRYWGRMRGTLPAPDTNIVRLQRWRELTFESAPWQPGRVVFSFTGHFRCIDTDEGCQLTHGYEMRFRRPFRWVYEPLLDGWLQGELDDELDRVHAILGGSPA